MNKVKSVGNIKIVKDWESCKVHNENGWSVAVVSWVSKGIQHTAFVGHNRNKTLFLMSPTDVFLTNYKCYFLRDMRGDFWRLGLNELPIKVVQQLPQQAFSTHARKNCIAEALVRLNIEYLGQ
ncbi:MAG: hypothetical protein LBM93_07025 [Oscillospiraceae bacterium]|jgi:hypothetical protein|nr:hypothetical protein [Oscillospiraceae bacterium]